MSNDGETDAGGCWVLFIGLMIVALIVATLISLAAIVDPFSWMPSVSEVWEHCEEGFGEGDKCDLHVRFPGFWWHAAANLAYFVIVGLLLAVLGGTTADLRAARAIRFTSVDAARAYEEKRSTFAGLASLTAACGIVPIIVAAI